MEPRYLAMRQGISNRVISVNNMSDENCVVVGSGTKEYGTNKMHNKGVPGSARSPLYVFQSEAYLTRAKVTLTLRTLLQCVSIPTELHASHSFRIGAATTAAEAGLPPWVIHRHHHHFSSSSPFLLFIQKMCDCLPCK